jgi:hypothetical protein
MSSARPEPALALPLSVTVIRAENGVIVERDHNRHEPTYIADVNVFTNPDKFAEYMRAWFVAHHGETPVTRLPKEAT